LLRLTENGRALLAESLQEIRDVNDLVFRGISREDFQTLRRVLGELVENLRDANDFLDRKVPAELRDECAG
jgi:DNA-binding MarR family transcriptional regulator